MKHTPDLLLFAPKPAHNGTRTSRAAAVEVETRAPSCRTRIFEYLKRCGNGATNEDLASGLGIRMDTVKARVHELGQQGMVVALKETRATSTGSEALQFITHENVHGRELEPWPLRRTDWKALHDAMERRAIDAERRVEELEQRLAHRTTTQESAA